MPLIVATTPDQLHEIPIHDAWFEVDRLVHDKDERTLVVPFAQDPDQTPEALQPQPDETSDPLQPQLVREQRLSTEYRAPVVGWQLTVFYVRELHAKDGWGDMGMLTGLSFDATRSQLTLRSNGKLTVRSRHPARRGIRWHRDRRLEPPPPRRRL